MLIYNKTDLDRYFAYKKIAQFGDGQEMNDEARKEFEIKFPYPFYSPSFFIRLGLFLATSIMVLLFAALLWLLTGMSGADIVYGFIFLIVGGLCVAAADFLARRKKHFKSGADESLHFLAAMFVSFGIGIMVGLTGWMIASVITVVSFLLFLRYMNSMMAALATVSCFVFLAKLFAEFFPVFVYATPLIFVSLAANYLFANKKENIQTHYQAGAIAARYCLLAVACFFSNYVCISSLRGNYTLPFELVFFKFTTILVPVMLLAYGILKKDIIAVHVAMVAFFLMVYSIYVFINATDGFAWMCISGGILIIVAIIFMRWLKNAHGGFVYRVVKKPQPAEWLEILLSANASRSTQAPFARGYGGGDFGGGGASGGF